MLRAALIYAKRFRVAVFPSHWVGPGGACSCRRPECESRGKHPLTRNGFKDATLDADVTRGWWSRWPDGNVSIATGTSCGIIVLDVDPRHNGDLSLLELETRHGNLPETPCVLTGGGGLHLYFRMPAGIEIPSRSGVLGRGLDIRADGGYVIAPPSLRASGAHYCWEVSARIDEVPVADPPDWLLQLILVPPSIRHTGASDRHVPPGRVSFQRLVAGVPDGKRDQELFRLAYLLRRQGYSRSLAEEMVLDAARRCKPAFPERAARQKVQSAWKQTYEYPRAEKHPAGSS
jgi:hypothetical protein